MPPAFRYVQTLLLRDLYFENEGFAKSEGKLRAFVIVEQTEHIVTHYIAILSQIHSLCALHHVQKIIMAVIVPFSNSIAEIYPNVRFMQVRHTFLHQERSLVMLRSELHLRDGYFKFRTVIFCCEYLLFRNARVLDLVCVVYVLGWMQEDVQLRWNFIEGFFGVCDQDRL